MNSRTRKLALVGLAVLLAMVFVIGGWWRNPAPKVLDTRTNLPRDGRVVLGTKVACVMRIQTSWRGRPTGALRLELPEGVSLAPDATVRLQTVGWGLIRWYVLAELRAARPGPVPAGLIHVPLRPPGQQIRLEVPAFTVTLPPVDSADPEVAPLPPPPPAARWLGWLVLLLIGSFIWYWVRRQRQPRRATAPAATSPPSLAERLEALRPRLAAPDAALFGELCDLVAEHLQGSYGVPLVGFWQQAEGIRFAGQSATPGQAEAAFRAAAALLAQGRGGGG
jgi:hypothetical protein